MTRRLVVFVAICFTLESGGLAQKPAPPKSADRIAFESVCGTCHAVTLIDGFRSLPDWKETVEDMIKYGARGSSAQFDAVMRYLLRNWTKTNVNLADAAEMGEVLGIAATQAQALVDYRTAHGPFKTIDELKKACGASPDGAAAKIEARKDRIVFE